MWGNSAYKHMKVFIFDVYTYMELPVMQLSFLTLDVHFLYAVCCLYCIKVLQCPSTECLQQHVLQP